MQVLTLRSALIYPPRFDKDILVMILVIEDSEMNGEVQLRFSCNSRLSESIACLILGSPVAVGMVTPRPR